MTWLCLSLSKVEKSTLEWCGGLSVVSYDKQISGDLSFLDSRTRCKDQVVGISQPFSLIIENSCRGRQRHCRNDSYGRPLIGWSWQLKLTVSFHVSNPYCRESSSTISRHRSRNSSFAMSFCNLVYEIEKEHIFNKFSTLYATQTTQYLKDQSLQGLLTSYIPDLVVVNLKSETQWASTEYLFLNVIHPLQYNSLSHHSPSHVIWDHINKAKHKWYPCYYLRVAVIILLTLLALEVDSSLDYFNIPSQASQPDLHFPCLISYFPG